MNISHALVLAALGLLLPISLAAQQPPPLTPGQRVRVTAPSAGMRDEMATVESVSADTLVLQRIWAGQPLRSAVPLGSVQALETSRGKRGNTAMGAVLGGTLGLVAGALASSDCFMCDLRLIGAGLGVGLGAIIGAGATTELWDPVPLSRIRVGLAPLHSGRLGLGASLSL